MLDVLECVSAPRPPSVDGSPPPKKGPGSYLFATQSGRAYSVSNYERLLRTFVDDNERALGEAGIVPHGCASPGQSGDFAPTFAHSR